MVKKKCLQCDKEKHESFFEEDVCCLCLSGHKTATMYRKGKVIKKEPVVQFLPIYVRNTQKYSFWRYNILKRDNFRCVFCEERKVTMHVHHIKPYIEIFREHDIDTLDKAINCEELWYEKNGICLCIECHRELHKNNTYN